MNSVNFDINCPSLDNLSQTSEYGSADSSLNQGHVPEGGIGIYDVNGSNNHSCINVFLHLSFFL